MKERGQVTIFIIAGVLIITAVALFFFLRQGMIPGMGGKPEENPNLFLEICIEDKLIEGVELISSQGGYIENPLNKTFMFTEEGFFSDISYLCYNQNNYLPCINQEPMLIQHLKQEIKNDISDDVETCWNNLISSLQDKYDVVNVEEYEDFEIRLAPNKIIIDVDGKIILTKSGETTEQENLEMIIPSRFYDLAIVVQKIFSKEAVSCDFDNSRFMIFYPEFKIDKFIITSDSTKIYTVEHRNSKEKFRFAVRGCVI